MVKAGRHCLIALSGGGGFLFRHRLDRDQVILRMNGTGVLGVIRLSSGSMQPELMIKSRMSAPSPATTSENKSVSQKQTRAKWQKLQQVAEASASGRSFSKWQKHQQVIFTFQSLKQQEICKSVIA